MTSFERKVAVITGAGSDIGRALTSPEKAAEVILAGAQQNKPRVLIGPDARGFDMVPRVVGPRYQDIASTATRLGRKVTRR